MRCMHLDDALGGYGLHTSFPELGLEKGYRLIEDGNLHDVHALKDADVPIDLTFFNTTVNMGLNLICPLFRIAGFTYSMIHLDAMHILDLGTSQYLIGAIFLLMVKKNFARRLRVFYKMNPRTGSGVRSRIDKISLKMFSKGRLQAKAAETKHLLPFAQLLLSENQSLLSDKDKLLNMACTELVKLHDVMAANPRVMTESAAKSLQRHMLRFLRFWHSWGGHVVFKHHMSVHLVANALKHGNPKFYTCYPDERFNRVMGRVAKSVHGGSTFYSTMLGKIIPSRC
ncbi:unnamed protein product [Prorocentrum cordatum]|uniref:Uncharacterized protein n=1 Tax=Prorocentrum cordatum TaxID=2364126 RepID=A0ABN9U8K1_9DINO|nr:unnamed protein product [Polarella glacialis]